jgi:hypothetical protein
MSQTLATLIKYKYCRNQPKEDPSDQIDGRERREEIGHTPARNVVTTYIQSSITIKLNGNKRIEEFHGQRNLLDTFITIHRIS